MRETQITAAVSAAIAATSWGYFSTAGNLLGPPWGRASSSCHECGWSSTLDKPQFHFSTSWDFCGQDWVGQHLLRSLESMSAVKGVMQD